jgi:hypothetical protein
MLCMFLGCVAERAVKHVGMLTLWLPHEGQQHMDRVPVIAPL